MGAKFTAGGESFESVARRYGKLFYRLNPTENMDPLEGKSREEAEKVLQEAGEFFDKLKALKKEFDALDEKWCAINDVLEASIDSVEGDADGWYESDDMSSSDEEESGHEEKMVDSGKDDEDDEDDEDDKKGPCKKRKKGMVAAAASAAGGKKKKAKK